jgi:DNA polymerase III subunit alpha
MPDQGRAQWISFGNRAALLASLDRLVAISSNHFRAAEAGQMSLFGAVTGVTESITLPDVSNVDRREMLNWERELIGLYISDHPLTPYQQTFTQIVSYFSGQLHEAQHEEKVRVAGLITCRPSLHDQDQQADGICHHRGYPGQYRTCALPRTWAQYREQLTVGQIIIVEGKADPQRHHAHLPRTARAPEEADGRRELARGRDYVSVET